VGTLSNVIVVGIIVNWVLDVLFCPHGLPTRMAVLGAAIVLNGLSTGYYIGAGLGPGPRDGLTTGFAARGHSVRVTRTVIEVSALVLGYFLGGSVGVGTIAYAVSIGHLSTYSFPVSACPHRREERPTKTRLTTAEFRNESLHPGFDDNRSGKRLPIAEGFHCG
jgi:uncharacterized membrane protein YczE